MRVSLRERSEPGANAPTKAQAVGVGPHGTNASNGPSSSCSSGNGGKGACSGFPRVPRCSSGRFSRGLLDRATEDRGVPQSFGRYEIPRGDSRGVTCQRRPLPSSPLPVNTALKRGSERSVSNSFAFRISVRREGWMAMADCSASSAASRSPSFTYAIARL